MQSLLDGDVYTHNIDGWSVSWESYPGYRHWCHQVKNPTWDNLLVVMFNPGSLSGDGTNLSRDTTLRILREVCGEAKLNAFVVNLFDYAAPSPQELFDNWPKKDPKELVFEKLSYSDLNKYVLAYGDYENWGQQDIAIRERQILIKNYLSSLSEIILPKNNSGTPKHPMIWQRQKLKPEIASILLHSA